MTLRYKIAPHSKVSLRQILLILLAFAPLFACGQSRPMTKAQSKAKMEAMEKLEKQYGISYYIDAYDLAIVLKDEHYGVATLDGRIVIPLEFGYASYEYPADLFVLFKEGAGVGFMDRQGNVVIPFEFSSEYLGVGVDYFNNGLMCAERNGKYGIIDKSGQVIVPYVYDWRINICTAGEKLMYLSSESFDTTYLLRFNGDTVMGPMTDIYMAKKGLLYVRKDTLVGLYSTDGKEIIPPQYDEMQLMEDGKIMVHRKRRAENGEMISETGVLDSKGRISAPFVESRQEEEETLVLKAGLVVKYRDNLCEVLDQKGKVIIPYREGYYYNNTKDRIALMDDNYAMNIYDIGGRLLEHFEGTYSIDESEYDGIPVSRDGKWGYVDKDLNLAIKPIYKELYQIDNEHCSALLDDGQRVLIDLKGNILTKGPYDSLYQVCDGIYHADTYVTRNGKKEYISGFVDIYGQTTLKIR